MRPVQDSSSSPVPAPAVPQNETRRQFPLPLPHFHPLTLSPGPTWNTSYNISSTPSVSHSVGRAVSCPCRVVTLTLTLGPPPGQASSPPIHPSHLPLFSSTTPCRRPGSQPPLLFTQLASHLARPPGFSFTLTLGLVHLRLPAPNSSFGTWEPVHLSSKQAAIARIGLDWTWDLGLDLDPTLIDHNLTS